MTDSYLWLEDRNGAEAVAWAQAQSKTTKEILESDSRFEQTEREILDILTSSDKIPIVRLYDGHAYNLWQDDKYKRGLWRRTTIQEYKGENPKWETLLDIDALAEKENQPWVYSGCCFLRGFDSCLLRLSKNNQDAFEAREFSLSRKEFVKDGFFIPEGKSNFSWLAENQLLIAPALTDEQKTNSGYARQAFCWTRGQDLAKAKLIYDGKKEDVSIWVSTIEDKDRNIGLIGRYVNYDMGETFVLDSELKAQKIPAPNDTNISAVFRGHIFFSLRSEWKGFSAGSVLAIPQSTIGLADVKADQIKLVYKPNDQSAFEGISHTSDRIYLHVSENVQPQIYEAKLDTSGDWKLEKIFNSTSSVSAFAADDFSDVAIFQEEGYLQPRRLILKEGSSITEIKKSKSYFDESAFVTEQLWTTSKDGTKIPYTVVRARDLEYNRANATLLDGYGGFAISRMPTYNAVMGKSWLEKGGVYVMANIRGGGEFGPQWHKAAMKENKQKSYDDFIAVAEDLVRRKITSPAHLAIQGGSNGGLLVGAVTMQRPDLFNAVICRIPLLDMIRYTKLPPGASWADEYGDPEDPKFRDIIMKYSPYQNISK